MRHLFWYIRSSICKHNWNIEEIPYELFESHIDSGKLLKRNVKVSSTCSKCGWHRKYYKF